MIRCLRVSAHGARGRSRRSLARFIRTVSIAAGWMTRCRWNHRSEPTNGLGLSQQVSTLSGERRKIICYTENLINIAVSGRVRDTSTQEAIEINRLE